MDPDQYERAFQAFQRCRELEPEARPDYLDQAVGGDAALRRQVEALLVASADGGLGLGDPGGWSSWIEGTTELGEVADAVDRALEPAHPTAVGPFRIVRSIGEGGMGRVFEAEQSNPKRRVALKLVSPHARSTELMQRFALEADVLARLQHPGIAPVYECGEHAGEHGPQPWFAMEFVDGLDVRTFAERARLDVRAKLALVAEIADAVEHAHTKGIVHRDLKPDNVLVDVQGRPKVLDFGIARVTDDSTLMRTAVTEAGQLIGTLNYMAPEQLGGDSTRVGRQADVYSLGVILFELLSGQRPHEVAGLALTAAIRVVAEDEAPRLGRLVPGLAHDVETIVGKALEKDPDRRYATAGALAGDLRRYLARQPISARPPSALYLARRFTQRHRGAVGGLAIALLALSIGIALALRFGLQSRADKEVAVREALRASLAAASSTLAVGDPALTRAHLESIPAALRGWEWEILTARAAPKYVEIPDPTETGVYFVAVGNVRPILAMIQRRREGQAGRCWLVELDTWKVLDTFDVAPVRGEAKLAFRSDDRELVVVGCAPDQRTLAVTWNLEERRITNEALLREGGWATGIELSWDGARAAIGHHQKHHAEGDPYVAYVHDTRSGELIRRLDSFCWQHMTFGADGRLLASHEASRVPHVVDLETGQERFPAGPLGQAVLSPHGARVVVPASGNVNEVWDLDGAPRLVTRFRGHGSNFAFSPNGDRVARAGRNGELYVHEVSSVRELGPFGSQGDFRHRPAFTPDGERIVTVSRQEPPRVWSLAASPRRALVGHASYVYSAASIEDPGGLGHVVATGGWDGLDGEPGCLRLWDVRSGAAIGSFGGSQEIVRDALAAIPGTTDLIVCRERLGIAGHETLERVGIDGEVLWSHRSGEGPRCLALDPTGRRSVASTTVGKLWIVQNETGELLFERTYAWGVAPENNSYPVAWSRDGSSIALATEDFTITILDARDFRERLVIEAHEDRIQGLAFGPEGWLLSGSDDGTARVWDVASGERLAQLDHGRGILGVSVRPDGSRIAIGTDTGATHVWDPGTFTELVRLEQHSSYVKAPSWSRDGEMLFTPSGDGTVGVWNAVSGLDFEDARRERERLESELAPQLDELLAGASDYATARATLAERELSPRERQVALQLFVGERWARRSGRVAALNESAVPVQDR